MFMNKKGKEFLGSMQNSGFAAILRNQLMMR